MVIVFSDEFKTTIECPCCGKICSIAIGQTSHNGILAWYESIICHNCGLRSESDDIGFPPEKIRLQLIDFEGLWNVRLDNIKSQMETIKVIRKAFSIDTKEALRIIRNESKVIYSGTREEAIWLMSLLKHVGETPLIQIAK